MTAKPKDSTVRLRGVVTRGLGEAGGFTEIPWVKKQFTEILGIKPYPGTFNVTVLPQDRARLDAVRRAQGVAITPEDRNFCAATALHVSVGGKVRGAVVIPLVADYPADKLEIIAAENIKQALALEDGDTVTVAIEL
ncbi:MAG: DUF120 domain-containing protein [Chloroflexota bacterium]